MQKQVLLGLLPPFENKRQVIRKHQEVFHIMREVLNSHSVFASHYDRIAHEFCGSSVRNVAQTLYNFCRRNILYDIESEDAQTTRSPAAILEIGSGDCKHYASFIGGVLDAMNRVCGTNIEWVYRFASYNLFDSTPQHVFIVAHDGNVDWWIDPVLPTFNQRLIPSYYEDKKPKKMSSIGALYQISGVQSHQRVIGWTVETSTGFTTSGPTIVPRVGDDFYGADYLGLSRYGYATNTNLDTLTAQLQALIDKGPSPYTLSRGMVEKALRDNVQNWNFFYPNGTSPNPRKWDDGHLDYYRLTLTPDGRLTFATDQEPPHNWPNIHHLVDWANFLVQQFSPEKYIVLIDHLKRLGKGWKTPDEGSLWTIIKTGDVWGKKITDFAMNIPGLKEVFQTFGINMQSLLDFAKKKASQVVLPGGTKPTTGGNNPLPPTPEPTEAGVNPLMIALLAGGVLYAANKKKRIHGPGNVIVPLIGAGLLYLILTKGSNSGLENTPPVNP